jgi:hypothetical protein
VSSPVDRLARNYPPAFLAFLAHRNEKYLARAYELGRDALADGISLLDLIRTHHAVFGQVLGVASTTTDVAETVDAAAAFLVEALAPYEMARRGFMENAAPPPHPGPNAPR